jgi:uncharacterized protein (DUF2252 family)
LGPIARCNENVEVQLRDMDQTVPGNPAFDLVRLALSLAMAARSSDLPGVVTARLIEELMAGYLEALAEPTETTKNTDSRSATVRFLVREALRRKWRHLHRDSIGKRPKFKLGRRFLPLVPEERVAVEAFLSRERIRQLVTRIESRDDDAKIKLLDAAYWVKGCSSLGLWRAAALVRRFGSVAGLLARVDEVAPDSLRARIAANAGSLALWRDLARLRDDVPLPGGPRFAAFDANVFHVAEYELLAVKWSTITRGCSFDDAVP